MKYTVTVLDTLTVTPLMWLHRSPGVHRFVVVV